MHYSFLKGAFQLEFAVAQPLGYPRYGDSSQTILLAAVGYRLGCCPEEAVADYPGEIMRILGIPESKRIICGIAIGYLNMDAPINSFRSNRESVGNLVAWHGLH